MPPKDDSRFDSGAFGPRRLPDADLESPDLPRPTAPAVQQAAIKRADETVVTSAETADLLEALRRRRGQREPLPGIDEVAASRAHSPVALFDALEPGYDETPADDEPEPIYEQPASRSPKSAAARAASSMPSWDEIVFGARTED